MGLVHDEYGAFQGVVTSADILESIVGGFHTEEGPPEAAAVKRDDGSYLISGWMSAVEFASLLRVELPPSRHYQTVAGFLLSHFGRIPDVGDQIEVEGWRFEVLDLDGRRIDNGCMATSMAEQPEPDEDVTSGIIQPVPRIRAPSGLVVMRDALGMGN